MAGKPDRAKMKQFFEVAEPLFERFGYRKTTVEEICHAAGASKRTFYGLFSDKADFLGRMLVHMAADAVEGWRERVDPSLPVIERLGTYIEGYEKFGREHPVFSQALYEEEFHACGNTFMEDERGRSMYRALEELLAEGVASGELRPLDPKTMVWVIDGLLDSMYYVFPHLTGERSAFADPVLARELRTFIFEGIRNHHHDLNRRDS